MVDELRRRGWRVAGCRAGGRGLLGFSCSSRRWNRGQVAGIGMRRMVSIAVTRSAAQGQVRGKRSQR
jgi:hypothetical protein